MFDADSASDSALQRSHGAARLGFARRGGRSRIVARYAAAPARILTPSVYGSAPEAVLANTSGGVAGGDSMRIDVSVEAGAEGVAVGQAAERIYRALDAPATVETDLRVGPGGSLQWLPQETILFDGAMLNRRISVDLAADARLLLAEMVVFGRKAHGERFGSGLFHDFWRIDRAGRPLWRERTQVTGGDGSETAMLGFDGRRALASVIVADPDGARLVEPVRDLLADLPAPDFISGASFRRGLLICRMLSDDAGPLKRALAAIVGHLRALAFDGPATPPRVWQC